MAQKSQAFVQSLLIGMIITGSLNTLVYKYQNTTVIDGVRYNHPFMQVQSYRISQLYQALCMFIGESLCFVFYLFKQKEQAVPFMTPDKEAPKLIILLGPATLDLITSSLQHIALNFIPSSIYQMLRGGVVIITAFFSKVFLKKVLSFNQKFGILFTMIGIFIVGLSNFLFSQSSSNDFSFQIQLISVILVLLSLLTQGGQYALEEKLLSKYEMNTFYMVGGEGIWGLFLFAFLMPALNFIPCNFEEGCVIKNNKGYMERTDVFYEQVISNVYLLVAVILGVFSIALYNLCGVNVTKYVSAVARTVIDVARTVVIWLVGLAVTEWSSRKWENMTWKANLMELVGYLILVFGNLVYNSMINIENKIKQRSKVQTDSSNASKVRVELDNEEEAVKNQ